MRSTIVIALCAMLPGVSFAGGQSVLTLEEALARALRGNLELESFSWDLRAADARTLQAGLRPNPSFSLELEELRWQRGPAMTGRSASVGFEGVSSPSLGFSRAYESGADAGVDGAEITAGISYEVELGGKRAKRIRLAEQAQEIARWDYEAARADVITSVKLAYAEVAAAQEGLALRNELMRLAESVSRTMQLRVEAGKVSPLALNRAESRAAAARAAREQAIGAFAGARVMLASLWGAEAPDFERVADGLDPQVLLPLDALQRHIASNPDVARWADEMAAREAKYDARDKSPDTSRE